MVIANLNKKQYISPEVFNDSARLSDYLNGDHARAVSILVCEGGPGVGPSSKLWEEYAGSWSGDRVVAAVDTGEPPNLLNSFGVKTSTPENPDRNLFGMVWEEFKDISYPMLILLCASDREFADNLLARTSPKNLHYLWHVGNALALFPDSFGTGYLARAVSNCYGPEWERLYQEQSVREQEHAVDDGE